MSKTQLASEPSMEDILASIRKMISDDRPGPSPMPDQMSRTPFAQAMQASAVSEFNARNANAATGPAQPSGGQPASFNSLADALKVATALSDQRRSLQQEIAQVLDKGPRGGPAGPAAATPATGRQDNLHSLPDAGATSEETGGPRLPNFPGWRGEPAAGAADGKRELMSFDFGTVVPQREDQTAKTSLESEAMKPAATQPSGQAASPSTSNDSIGKPEIKADPQSAEAPRVLNMPTRTSSALNGSSLNGGAAHASGLNGTSLNGSGANSGTVAPFPRSPREAVKPAAEAAPVSAEKTPDKQPAAKIETPAASGATSSPAASTSSPASQPETSAGKVEGSAQTEALLDAVVDLVQQQPSALSVFTSGASFIGGVGAKKVVADAIASAGASLSADKADASSASGAPPKLDRAAAELLRPMLRQWLADNMPRIVEEALRSEMTDQTQGDDKGPGKA